MYHDNLDAVLDTEAKSETSNTAKWFSNMDVLIKASNEALKRIRMNINSNDFFDPNFKRLLDELFSDLDEFEYSLQSKLKNIIEKKQFDASKVNMFEIMNMINSIIENIVSNNLNQMKLIMPTKWYKNLKDKLLRQEIKAAMGYVAKKMCEIGVCQEPKVYSDYVKFWLRYLLNLKSKSLHEFFTFIPKVLKKQKHFLKSNVKLRKTMIFFLNSDIVTQKDYLALLDEMLVNADVFSVIPNHAKKTASLLLLLFATIDANYDVNDENKKELKSITDMFGNMMEGRYIYVPELFDKILDNLQLNNKIWPMKEQSKLDYLWAEIIH